jgi:hypothetical protein
MIQEFCCKLREFFFSQLFQVTPGTDLSGNSLFCVKVCINRNWIDGVLVIVLISSEVDYGFEPWLPW